MFKLFQLENGFKEGLENAIQIYGEDGKDEYTNSFNDMQKTVSVVPCISICNLLNKRCLYSDNDGEHDMIAEIL